MTPFWRGFMNGLAFLPIDTPISTRQPMRWMIFVGAGYVLGGIILRVTERLL